MLGIVLIYFIGRTFYRLAEQHGRSPWGFAILGVLSYYAGTFILGLALGIALEFWGSYSIDTMSDIQLALIALPAGLLASAALYFILKRIWKKNEKVDENLIDEIGKS
ncbi:MAG: hypothetical protein KTR22_10940 [Flavobacteriaceae bacterium]|nr:hypothetical protein [Flavobacteriaceae bacterium]